MSHSTGTIGAPPFAGLSGARLSVENILVENFLVENILALAVSLGEPGEISDRVEHELLAGKNGRFSLTGAPHRVTAVLRGMPAPFAAQALSGSSLRNALRTLGRLVETPRKAGKFRVRSS